MRRFWSFLGLLTILFMLGGTVALLSSERRIPALGTVKTIGVDADVSSVDWGFVEPGSYTFRIVNFRSSGTVPVVLSLSTATWLPVGCEQYFVLSWNYIGTVVDEDWVPVEFSLYVLPTIQSITDFSFDIVVTGTEVGT